ncbi:MAG: hypothetical protein U0232_20495 [Thermomicrobiales bacterium]
MAEPGTATSSGPTTPPTSPTPGLRIGIFNAPPGVTTLAPLRDHLINIHVGAPVASPAATPDAPTSASRRTATSTSCPPVSPASGKTRPPPPP